jgi:hypothetical protein
LSFLLLFLFIEDTCNETPSSLLVGFVGLTCLSGCSGSDKYVPVSGQVIIDGEPVEGCSVTFTPISGAVDDKDAPFGSYAHTDKDGRLTLKVIDPDNSIEGAAVGKHRVYLSTGDDTDQIDPHTGSLRGGARAQAVPRRRRVYVRGSRRWHYRSKLQV